jgi:Fe2+ or Zn2+ uptake regulation protein/O6-methylguanine-DNA--protein-cysteine methyltransferase
MPDDPGELLRSHSLRVTPQRRAILGVFSGGPAEHLAAEEVHARALRAVPELGRGTVYATLAELNELGILGAVGAPEPVRYETNVAPHHHFRCRVCMRLFDIEIEEPSTAALEKEGFVVERVVVAVEGVCAECRLYEKGLEDGARLMTERRLVDDGALANLACSRHETPLGTVALAASETGVVRIAFDDHADFEPLLGRARTRRGPRAARLRLDHAAAAVDSFFAGSERRADDDFDPDGRGAADDEALEASRLIPYGTTLSYDRLEGPLDPYQLGYAFGSNPMPIIFPCHRITRGNEQPTAYVGGPGRRDAVLRIEEDRAPVE